MSSKGVLKALGIAGFLIFALFTALITAYIIIPLLKPLLISQIMKDAEKTGMYISKEEVVRMVDQMMSFLPIITPLVYFLVWLVNGLLVWGFTRLFKIRTSFLDSWLLYGNYFYVPLIATTVIATINPQLLVTMDKSFWLMRSTCEYIVGSALVGYYIARIYGVSFMRAFAALLTLHAILLIISLVLPLRQVPV